MCKTETMTIKLLGVQLSIKLLPFRQEKNEEYVLADTGGVLYLLRRLPALLYRLDKNSLKLAITGQTIREVVEHLEKSLEEKRKRNASALGVQKGMKNFMLILESGKIRKIADPKIPKGAQSSYIQYGEDMILAYLLFEGGFRGIVTQDRHLAEKLPKKKVIPCGQLFIK